MPASQKEDGARNDKYYSFDLFDLCCITFLMDRVNSILADVLSIPLIARSLQTTYNIVISTEY